MLSDEQETDFAATCTKPTLKRLPAFINKAEQDLKFVQRQSAISSMFNSGEKLIIEEQRIVRTAGDN
jgi:hypothetical protein